MTKAFNTDLDSFILCSETGFKNQSIPGWEVAYMARELRHKKLVTLTCHESEADSVYEQLTYFSTSENISKKKINKPNSNEIFLEISY